MELIQRYEARKANAKSYQMDNEKKLLDSENQIQRMQQDLQKILEQVNQLWNTSCKVQAGLAGFKKEDDNDGHELGEPSEPLT